ncbi:MAG: stage III sporulation protein AF [Lachnospiraceae bacterium]|nr:stage III sporulation protein AF [Lachnospiraceae bacterium]
MVNTESVNAWVLQMCICAIIVVIAENLLPEGNVRKSVYFLLGLITLTCFLTPIRDFSLNDLTIDNEFKQSQENVDWLNRETDRVFRQNITTLVEQCVSKVGAKSEKIELSIDTDEDNCISISYVRVTVSEQYRPMIGDISTEIYKNLGFDADVVVG